MPQFLRRASVKYFSELRCFFTHVEIGFRFGPYLVAKERYGMSRGAAVLMVGWLHGSGLEGLGPEQRINLKKEIVG
jgi:hypothetical protein